MAHGELMMLGAYTTYGVQTLMPAHIGISILGRFLRRYCRGVAGVVMERTIIRFLYGRPWRRCGDVRCEPHPAANRPLGFRRTTGPW